MIDLSICIANWNTRELLALCLASIQFYLETVSYEIIVVDNGSRDGSVAMVRECFPGVQLINNAENLGFARATNQALRVSRGRYKLLLNSDTRLIDKSLVEMIAFMDRNPVVGVAGACLLNLDGTIQAYPTRLPSMSSHLLETMGFQKLLRPTQQTSAYTLGGPREVERVKGACLMARSEAVEQVGFLDEESFMYGEEDDWCLRMMRAGWKIFYLPNVRVIHHGRASVDQVNESMYVALFSSKVRFYRKYHGALRASLLKALFFCGSWLRLIFASISLVLGSSARVDGRASLRRNWKLLRELPKV